MALSLRAEQKSITDLFTSGEDIYVIPEYQRPYSWNKDSCYQFYLDITSAFVQNTDYFIGNIVMARGNEDKKRPCVVDGQQRLITLWIWIKVMTLLHPDKVRLKRLLEVESVLSDFSLPRINSNVYEHDDQKNLESVMAFEVDSLRNMMCYLNNKVDIGESVLSRIEANALYLYVWMSEFYGNLTDQKQKIAFLEFFLERVYLLPIELDGKDVAEASDRALTIFETINNRGQALEDSDIFKARLFKSAKADGKEDDFISRWQDFNEVCASLNIKVDDLFRYYYHILRGQEGQTNNEGSLREYLISSKNSALNTKSYNEVISDLSKITDILNWLNAPDQLPKYIARWLQLINQYTNQYPKYALVNYLFIEGVEDAAKLRRFMKSIVRYYYYRGATIQVKYETYKINKLVAEHSPIMSYDCSDIASEYFDHLGLLRNGYALLAYYLMNPDAYVSSVYFDKLIYNRDMYNLASDWQDKSYDDIKNNIANIIVLDIPKKSLQIRYKAEYYENSKIKEVRNLIGRDGTVKFVDFRNREKKLKNVLLEFFLNNDYEQH